MPVETIPSVKDILQLSTAQLVAEYLRLHDEKPMSLSRRYLAKHIIYRRQEEILGGLSSEAQNKIEQLIRDNDLLKLISKSPSGKRRKKGLSVGSEISKWYKRRRLVVKVLAKGFEFEGERYRSLSAIAKKVTGSHWNGKLFFGVREWL